MFTDQPGVQFYTGNGLDGSPGKGGVCYPKYGAFCLEGQNYPDAINQVSAMSLGPFHPQSQLYSCQCKLRPGHKRQFFLPCCMQQDFLGVSHDAICYVQHSKSRTRFYFCNCCVGATLQEMYHVQAFTMLFVKRPKIIAFNRYNFSFLLTNIFMDYA